jgi:hypothetical protein
MSWNCNTQTEFDGERGYDAVPQSVNVPDSVVGGVSSQSGIDGDTMDRMTATTADDRFGIYGSLVATSNKNVAADEDVQSIRSRHL